jgi:hypothetical protein
MPFDSVMEANNSQFLPIQMAGEATDVHIMANPNMRPIGPMPISKVYLLSFDI